MSAIQCMESGFYWVVSKKDFTDIALVQVLPIETFENEEGESIEMEQEVKFFGVEDGYNWCVDALLSRCNILYRVDTPIIENGCCILSRSIVGNFTVSTIARPDHFETIVFVRNEPSRVDHPDLFRSGNDARFDFQSMIDALVHHGKLVATLSV